jgi:aspartyl protease family protein
MPPSIESIAPVKSRRPVELLTCLALTWMAAVAVADVSVEVQGLMRDTAVLRIDGRQQTLRAGQRSDSGVLLVSATPKQAVVEVDGRRHTLTLSQRISSSFAAADRGEVRVSRDAHNRYLTYGEVNGRRLLMLIDTGATQIALNEEHARLLGLDYRNAPSGQAATAGGMVQAWQVQLERVAVGPITLHQVPAMVLSGGFPTEVLLGMSYLKHVNLSEQDGVMVLQQKF